MIVGVGIDILETERMVRELARDGGGLRDSVFTAGEIAEGERSARPAAHFTACFAAKEAIFKAFGGIRERDVSWHDLDVRSRPDGTPEVVLHGAAERLAGRLGVKHIRLTLSTGEEMAAAVVILES
jgi:holo-[acyl-carrier protein] synthase